MHQARPPVPVRTIAASIGLVLATIVGLYTVVVLARIEALLVVAAFFAVVLTPPVDFVSRILHLGRALATLLVVLVGVVLVAAMLYAFIRPLVSQTTHFVDKLPTYVSEAKAGRGPVGHLVTKYHLDREIKKNQDKLRTQIGQIGGGAVKLALTVVSGAVALLTVLVLAVLMIIYGPDLLKGGLGVLSPPRRERVRAVGRDCARAVTGYVFGNLLISLIAGLVTFFALLGFGVPFQGVLALWVGFADLIPLVGATLGAIPAVAVAFLHSTAAGIGMVVVFIIYQQFENHVLQVGIMARTVQINQLFVLISVLVGVELFGFLGALLAIPAAGVLNVIARDLWDSRTGRLKLEPTTGADEVPMDSDDSTRSEDVSPGLDAPDGETPSATTRPQTPPIPEPERRVLP